MTPTPAQTISSARPHRHRRLVLAFHGLGEAEPWVEPQDVPFWVPRELFLAVLDWASGRGDISITFDDGHQTDLMIALPALLSRGLSAEFFVPAGLIGHTGRLSCEQVRELADAGMRIGSHGMEHRTWRKLTPDGLRREIVEARDVLQDVSGQPVVRAAAPFGTYDARCLRALRLAQFERVYTSDGGTARDGRWLTPRHTVMPDESVARLEHLVTHESARHRAIRAAKMAIKRRRW